MFMVKITRVVKVNTMNTAKFSPRTANQETVRFSGPFSTRRKAEAVAVAAMATHTCLDAIVLPAETVLAMTYRDLPILGGDRYLPDAQKAITAALATTEV